MPAVKGAIQVCSPRKTHEGWRSDSNSDGKTDGFSTSDWVLFYPASGWSAQVGDFNGDGADDLFSVGNNGTAWISTATDTTGGTDADSVPDHFVNTQWTEWIGGQATWRVGDFNGDSRSDAGEVHDADTTSALDHRWQAWLINPLATSSYAYDDTDQLTDADHSDQTDEDYAYDENGNRTNSGYVTGAHNRLSESPTHVYEYDAEGNRTKATEKATGDYGTYAWDHRNRLTAVAFYTSTGVLTKKVELDYDPHGRRLRKNVDDDGDGVFDRGERFVYDSAGKIDPASGVAIDDLALLFATDDPTSDPAGSLKTRFLHGPAIDQVFADEDAVGEILWSLADRQGTVRDLVDYDATTDATTVATHRQFDAFGNLTGETDPTVESPPVYAGLRYDGDTGVYVTDARLLDPAAGRWLSEDPIQSGTNFTIYVGNSPTNSTDPSGLVEWYWPWDERASWNPATTLKTWGAIASEAKIPTRAAGALQVVDGVGQFPDLHSHIRPAAPSG